MTNIDRRLFIINTSLGALLANFAWDLPGFHANIWSENKKNHAPDIPSNELHFVRDIIDLRQSLVNRMLQNLQPNNDTVVISARIITLREDVQLNNINLVLVTDVLNGNNKVITIIPLQRSKDEYGQPGYAGKQITVFAKTGSAFSAVLKGGDGVKGAKGAPSPNAVRPNRNRNNLVNEYVAGTPGSPGQQGGMAGSGGNVIINTLTASTLNVTPAILTVGNPGDPGDGGDGGTNMNCTVQVLPPNDCEYQTMPGGGRQAGIVLICNVITQVWLHQDSLGQKVIQIQMGLGESS